MSNQEHEEEERMLREAKALRRKAHAQREARLERERKAGQEKLEAQRKAKEAWDAAMRAEEERLRKKKILDAELIAMLRPLAEQMKRTGWRFDFRSSVMNPGTIAMIKTNQYPSPKVLVRWREYASNGQCGFEWE